jgi:hypothetical protein
VDEKTLLATADLILKDLRDLGAEIQRRQAAYEEEAKMLAEKHQKGIAEFQAEMAEREGLIISLMKQNKGVLFDGRDKVSLKNGTIIYIQASKVTVPRDALAKCEAQGFTDVIKVVKSIDRGAIEKWPDAKLGLIGAKRRLQDSFSYDLARPT